MNIPRTFLALAVLTSTSVAVYAACDSTAPRCPWGAGAISVGTAVWPCCDQTRSCPIDGSKFARFFRSQAAYSYLGVDLQWHGCVDGPITDGGIVNNQCCGDPVVFPPAPPAGD